MALGIGRSKFLIKKIVFDVLIFYVFPLSEISAFSLFLQRKKICSKIGLATFGKKSNYIFCQIVMGNKEEHPIVLRAMAFDNR